MKREKREVLGEKREYLTIKILHNDMTVNVPAENAERVGLRKVIDEEAVKKVVKYLTSGGTEMPKNWNRRFKHNRDKMKTGDIFELAEVVRNLSLRDGEKGLSTGEKQMYVKAKKILASELMYAKNMSRGRRAGVARGDAHRRVRRPKPRRRGARQLSRTETPQSRSPPARRAPPRRRPPPRRLLRSQSAGCGHNAAAGGLMTTGPCSSPQGEESGWARPAEGVRPPRRASPARGVAAAARRERVDRRRRLVAPPEWEEPAILLAEELGASKVAACVTGGETRSASVRLGVAEVPDEAAVMLVHDAARPLLPPSRPAAARGARARASTAPCRGCR